MQLLKNLCYSPLIKIMQARKGFLFLLFFLLFQKKKLTERYLSQKPFYYDITIVSHQTNLPHKKVAVQLNPMNN